MIAQKDKKTIEEGSKKIFEYIQEALKEGTGALIGRIGSTEMNTIFSKTPEMYVSFLEIYSGVFSGSLTEWIETYKQACIEADIMGAGWYEPLAQKELEYLNKESWAVCVPLRSLEPYYSTEPWSKILSGRRVTVVSSFAMTMRGQIKKKLWDREILPEAQWSFVRSYFCPTIARGSCEWPSSVTCWKTAVEYLEKEVYAHNPKIVLIGCGGLSMPLALKLKRNGIIAIVLGGAIQILFGIKGLRWLDHELSEYFSETWVFPSDDEIPAAAEKIERGCYW
jgi:hypothetical protein